MAYFSKLLRLSRLQARMPITNQDGTGSLAFVSLLNRAFDNIENSSNDQGELLNRIAEILNIQNAQSKDIEDIKKMQADQAKEAALVNSYTDPTYVLSATSTATDSTIVVANHKRIYADAGSTTVNVTGKTFTGLSINTNYYFYYDDAMRAGGAVDIKYSTNNLDAAQTGIRHSLGSIQTPDPNESSEGGGVTPPGGSRIPAYKRPNENTNIE